MGRNRNGSALVDGLGYVKANSGGALSFDNNSFLPLTGGTVSFLYISGLTAGSAGNFIVGGPSGSLVTRTPSQVLSDIGGGAPQTIVLTGDVTGTGTSSFGVTISNNVVTLAKFQTVPSLTLLGRGSTGTGNIEILTLGSGLTMSGLTLSLSTNIRNYNTFTATASQSLFTVSGGYVPGMIDIYTNGVKLNRTDISATNSTTFTLIVPASAGDIVESIDWKTAGNNWGTLRSEFNFTATASQTTFTLVGGYTVGMVEVFYNGSRLPTTDFTASNGSDVVLVTGAPVSTIITIITYGNIGSGYITNTDQIPEGSTNKYFTTPRVLTSLAGATVSGNIILTGTISTGFIAQTTTNNSYPYFKWTSANRTYWAGAIDNGSDSTWKLGNGTTVGSNSIFSIDAASNVTSFINSTSLNLGNTSSAGVYFGDLSTSTTTSIFIKTGSVDSTHHSGLGIDGTYSGGLSAINFRAWEPNSGGYYSAYRFYNTVNGSQRLLVTFDGSGASAVIASPVSGFNGFECSVSGSSICYLANTATTSDKPLYFQCGGNLAGYVSHPTVTTTSYYTGPSDRRLKYNIQPWSESVLDLFSSTNPVVYSHLADMNESIRYKGFIAQEMSDKFPEAYHSDEDGIYGFNPSGMVVYLMKAIQELNQKFEEYKITHP